MKNFIYKTNKPAFTLAEVLITITVIGVIAALTISFAVSEYRKQTTVSKIRKVYNTLKNAENMAIAEHGDIASWDFSDHTPASTTGTHPSNNISFVDTYIFPYIKKVNCKYTGSIFTSSGIYITGSNYKAYVCMEDGTVIFGNFNSHIGAVFYADLNGNKKPNIVGKDVFYFIFNKPTTSSTFNARKCPLGISTCFPGQFRGNGYYFSGDEDDLIRYCTEGSNDRYTISNEGFSCVYMIEQAGWKIPKNYPFKF